jgi:hypothetical protein
MMKAVFVSAALLFAAAACTSGGAVEPAPSAAPQFRLIGAAGYAAREAAGELVARDQQTYAAAWREHVGEGEPPAIDFTNETAVFLFAGQRPTGGYSVSVKGVRVEGTTLVIDGGVQTPPPGGMSTQAITSPYAVIAVAHRDFTNVRWNR